MMETLSQSLENTKKLLELETPEQPQKPSSLECEGGCGKLIEPEFVPAAIFLSSLIKGTNEWHYPDLTCWDCKTRVWEEKKVLDKKETIKSYISGANIPKRFVDAEISDINGKCLEALRGHIEDYLLRKNNLFIHGACGVGKTFPAVALLKEFIRRNGYRGRFKSVPSLCDELRVGIRNHTSEDILEELMNYRALVLDDLGVERPTEYVIERLYLFFNYWYENMQTGLIITSNRLLDDIGQRLDDRISSRIFSMCAIVEITGKDRRIG